MSSSSASLYTSSMRMNGTDLVSGLDTSGIIKKLLSGTQSKINNQKRLEQMAEWKQEAYREITKQIQDFQSTYFSYSNDSTNLLSSSFFDLTTLISSSPLVQVSGSASNAANMAIQSISSLASKAAYSSSQRVSDESITSGKIQTEWTSSSIGGKSLVLEYEGTEYTVHLGGDLQLDSNDTSEDKVQKIVDELNKRVDATDGLKGNVSFSKTSGGAITLKTTNASERVTIKDYKTDNKDTSGKKLLNALGFSVGDTGSSITGSAVDTSVDGYLFNKTVDADSELKLNVNGQTYTLTLGADYDVSDGTPGSIAKNIAVILNERIDADSDLKGKLTVSAADGKISFKSSGQNVKLSLEGGSRNLLNGLGLNASVGGALSSEVAGTGVDEGALTASYLPDVLSGSSITLNVNGLSKTFTFDKGDLQSGESFDDVTGIANYLTRKLNRAYGTNGAGKSKITVEEKDGGLIFRTSDENSVLTFSSSDNADVLSSYGALRINTGESNRTEFTKTLGELSKELNQPLTAGSDGKYTFTVNGSEFKFSRTDTLNDVITKINDDKDANVTVSYSQTANTFRVSYDETGTQGTTNIADAANGGNLAGVLFGVNYSGLLNQAPQPDSQTLSQLYGAGVKGITANKNDSGTIESYSITGTDKTFSGDTVLSAAVTDVSALQASGTVQGTDLHMKMTLNGSSTPIDIIRSSNTTTVDGVDITVTGTTTDDDGNIIGNANITFSAKDNTDDLYKKISDFVNDYNEIIDTINTKITETSDKDYKPLTDDQKKEMSESEIKSWEDKAKEGILQNDSTLSKILTDLRTAMTGIVESTGTSLSQIGISTIALDYTSGGQLTVDSDALKKALSAEPDKIAEMFTSEDGVAQRVNNMLNKYAGTFGGDGTLLLIAGTDSRAVDTSELGTRIADYKKTISNLNDQYEMEENRYWTQFTAMEQSLNNLMSQSSYLSSMLDNSSS